MKLNKNEMYGATSIFNAKNYQENYGRCIIQSF